MRTHLQSLDKKRRRVGRRLTNWTIIFVIDFFFPKLEDIVWLRVRLTNLDGPFFHIRATCRTHHTIYSNSIQDKVQYLRCTALRRRSCYCNMGDFVVETQAPVISDSPADLTNTTLNPESLNNGICPVKNCLWDLHFPLSRRVPRQNKILGPMFYGTRELIDSPISGACGVDTADNVRISIDKKNENRVVKTVIIHVHRRKRGGPDFTQTWFLSSGGLVVLS